MIPKIIHHIAPKDRKKWHPVWEKSYVTWLRHYPEPEHKHMLWDDKEAINNLVKLNFPEFYDTYSKMKEHIMKIDFAKAVMVYVYGGMYVDMDFYCIENFHNDLNNEVALSLSPYYSAKYREKIQNALFACTTKHPFMLAYIQDMIVNIKTKDSKLFDHPGAYVMYTTGPNALGLSYLRHQQYKDNIQLLPYEIYNPHLNECRKYIEGESTTYRPKCIHLLSGIWGKKSLREPGMAKGMYEDWRKIKLDNL